MPSLNLPKKKTQDGASPKEPDQHRTQEITSKRCAVPGCVSKFYGASAKKRHYIPPAVFRGKENPKRDQWIRACQITCDYDDLPSEAAICEEHFVVDEDYNTKTGRLLGSAVPSRNLPQGNTIDEPMDASDVDRQNEGEESHHVSSGHDSCHSSIGDEGDEVEGPEEHGDEVDDQDDIDDLLPSGSEDGDFTEEEDERVVRLRMKLKMALQCIRRRDNTIKRLQKSTKKLVKNYLLKFNSVAQVNWLLGNTKRPAKVWTHEEIVRYVQVMCMLVASKQ